MKVPLTPKRGETKSLSNNQKSVTKNKLKVVELFAGVGGFRIALEGYPKKKEADFEVIWSNQYEPRTKKQHANMVYKNRFGSENHSEKDIEHIVQHQMHSIPKHDLLVGGFPCQDFSIANRTHNKGIEGEKGKLWWAIHTILKEKRPKYILLENVNRLLSSPAKQNGRDFSIILHCLNQLGYAVEWRVINAADYGFPQRRRRVFIFGYHKKTPQFKKMSKTNPKVWIVKDGIAAKTFPVLAVGKLQNGKLLKNMEEIQKFFLKDKVKFEKAGIMMNGNYYSNHVKAQYD
ncbi:DNA cytosine methyltransferase [Polaribacter porphyrae]|uniref:DNA cytosine methyltransferase n=1 Tax=Polaribacter porphyrae TaxID=1137780 RepID=UPI001CFFF5A2|nr:DNA (cytosine-5-)-methyltransferase [Polaribacter porphyrae]